MSKKTITPAPGISQDEQPADKLLQAYAYQKAAKQAAADEMKSIEALLLQLARRHPEWFADKNTFTLPHGKLRFGQSTELVIEENYDAQAFASAFPGCVKLTPTVTAIKAALLDHAKASAIRRLGVDVKLVEKFEVTV